MRRGITRIARRETAGLLGAAALVALVPLSAAAQPSSWRPSAADAGEPRPLRQSALLPREPGRADDRLARDHARGDLPGRPRLGGSCDIGWATSTDGGNSWQTGLLPLTVYGGQATTQAGPLTRASDPAVAYDAEDGIWLINTLGLAGDAEVPGMFVNRSSDGLDWGPPIATHVASGNDSPDKNWITCDNWPDSAGYGNCYEEYDNSAEGGRIKMQTSTDGGLTWSLPANIANNASGIGGVPLVQPPPPGAPPNSVCGRVVVPIALNGMSWFTSTNCGVSWSAPTQITPNMTAEHSVAGGLRTSLLPGSAMDGAGAIYAVWQTRSFRTQNTTLASPAAAGDTCVRLASISGLAAGQTLRIDPNGPHPEVVTIGTVGTSACNGGSGATISPALGHAHTGGTFVTKNNVAGNLASDPNDIALSVMPAPTDPNPAPSFGGPVRIPIEADSGGMSNRNDHFISGIGADPSSGGSTAHLGLFYYSYRVATCQAYNADNLCMPRVGYVSSRDGGAHWTSPTYLATMTLAEIARSSQGPMVGDYAAADVIPAGPCQGRAIESFAVGLAPAPDDNALSEAMYAPTCGLPIGISPGTRPAGLPPSGRLPVPQQLGPVRRTAR